MMFKVRTVDVWDTLLRRRCHPETIKQMTAKNLFFRFNKGIEENYSDVSRIYKARLDVELKLANSAQLSGLDDEYSIYDVFKNWLEDIFDNQLLRQFGELGLQGLIDELVEYEISNEMQQTYVDPDILTFIADYPAERTLFLSDFYMDSGKVKRLLEHHSLSEIIPDGYVSCDLKINKRSGALFEYLQRELGVKPEEQVHIGDNRFVDVEVPSRMGIRAVHFLPSGSIHHHQRIELDDFFHNQQKLFASIERLALTDIIDGRAFQNPQVINSSDINYRKIDESNSEAEITLGGEAEALFRLGICSAPLFVGFAIFCEERRKLDGLDRLCFLTREGEFFYKVHNTLFAEQGDSLGDLQKHIDGGRAGYGDSSEFRIDKTNILEVSRLATLGATFDADDLVNSFRKIWDVHRVQNVSGIFTTLGLHIGDFLHDLEVFGLGINELIVQPGVDKRVTGLLKSRKLKEAARRSILNQRQGLQGYLSRRFEEIDRLVAQSESDNQISESSGNANHRIGVVDIGWSGSIQDNLAQVCSSSQWYGYYLAMTGNREAESVNRDNGLEMRSGNPDMDVRPRATKSSYLLTRDASTRQFFDGMHVLEMLCSSKGGTVVGYELEKGNQSADHSGRGQTCQMYLPLRVCEPDEERFFCDVAASFQEGVLFAAKRWRRFLNHHIISSRDLVPAGKKVWLELIRQPLPELVRGILTTPQHDGLIFGDYFRRSDAPKLKSYFRAVISRDARSELKNFARRFQWSESIAHLKGLTGLERIALEILLSAFKIGQKIKLRMR